MGRRWWEFVVSACKLYWLAVGITLFVAMPQLLNAVGAWRWNVSERYSRWLDVTWPWRVMFTAAVFLLATAWIHHRLRMDHLALLGERASREVRNEVMDRLGAFGLELKAYADEWHPLADLDPLRQRIIAYIEQTLGASVVADFLSVGPMPSPPEHSFGPRQFVDYHRSVAYQSNLVRIREGIRRGTIEPLVATPISA
ncbi:MAG: hypothetical protein IT332_02875 [Ardenticatenales bacterium]|nr:hypothetical protein [Ardenticatenales bacterium]